MSSSAPTLPEPRPDDEGRACQVCGWMHLNLSCREYHRRKRIVEFFAASHHRELTESFLASYDGPDDHDSIRDAYRPLLAPHPAPLGATDEGLREAAQHVVSAWDYPDHWSMESQIDALRTALQAGG